MRQFARASGVKDGTITKLRGTPLTTGRPQWAGQGAFGDVRMDYCPTKESSRFSAERMSIAVGDSGRFVLRCREDEVEQSFLGES